MKRVILFRNGTEVDGKVVLVTHSLEELLTTASTKFGIVAKRLFTLQGGEIDDIKLIRDDDILYVAEEENFIRTASYKRPVQSVSTAAVVPIDNALPTCSTSNSEWVTLNVGGKYFTTSKSTLMTKEPMSMLARMFAEGDDGFLMTPSNVDKNGAYLIDRSPTYFEPILNYLRNGQLIFDNNVSPEGILKEAKFFEIESLIPHLESIIQSRQQLKRKAPKKKQQDVKLKPQPRSIPYERYLSKDGSKIYWKNVFIDLADTI